MKAIKYYFVVFFIFLFSCQSESDNWTHFRGSNMDGHAQVEKAPTHWSDTENVVWKVPVKGIGWSSPVVYGKQVWLTSAEEDGTKFYTFCFDLESGKLLDEKTIFTSEEPQRIHSTNSYATPTPVIVDGKMYMVHDRGMVTCLDAMSGKPVWKEKLKGNFNASPIYAAGNIYFINVKGDCTIIKPGETFQKVAENSIGETVKAIPAFIDDKMILRTQKHLFLIKSVKK